MFNSKRIAALEKRVTDLEAKKEKVITVNQCSYTPSPSEIARQTKDTLRNLSMGV
jgi:hypothetical protein